MQRRAAVQQLKEERVRSFEYVLPCTYCATVLLVLFFSLCIFYCVGVFQLLISPHSTTHRRCTDVFKPDAPDDEDTNTVVSVMATLGSGMYPLDFDWDMDDLDVRCC